MRWFRPKCPVDFAQRDWLEWRMNWLVDQFGIERLRGKAVVLPTEEFFPEPYDGSVDAASRIYERVCRYMGVRRSTTELRFYEEARGFDLSPGCRVAHEGPGAAGLYETGDRHRISIERSQLADPVALVATMAHELGHVHLLGHRRVHPDEPDHEPLTDLLTVFFGLGIFNANSVLRERRWSGGGLEGWSISRLGYLPTQMHGYAFSLFAWARGELDPAWARYLRPDVREPFRKGLRYLRVVGETNFEWSPPEACP